MVNKFILHYGRDKKIYHTHQTKIRMHAMNSSEGTRTSQLLLACCSTQTDETINHCNLNSSYLQLRLHQNSDKAGSSLSYCYFISKKKICILNVLFIYFSHPPTEDSLLQYAVHSHEQRRESLPLSDFIRFFSLAIGFSNRSDSIANLREVFRLSRCPTHCL